MGSLCVHYTCTDKSMGDLFKPELPVLTRMGCTASDHTVLYTCKVMCHYVYSVHSTDHSMGDLFKPELAVPTRMGCTASRSHCALHMLGNVSLCVQCTFYRSQYGGSVQTRASCANQDGMYGI